ncbi:MAG: SMP-30/gluconolactonase/LRE family protein [Planctomycetaceae bacterium]|jgi:sugar lactone lactonase YvrE|nr:SMP-30/gluconolactonase/LRE family protein [Planctomycetaceae bacterium]
MKKCMTVLGFAVIAVLLLAETSLFAQLQRPLLQRRNRVRVRQVQQNPDLFKPELYLELPEWCHNPDGMTVCPKTGTIYLNCPNFNTMDRKTGKKDFPATLSSIDKDGKLEKLLEYPPFEETGQCGPMGLAIGPDGNLYVCDNQFFVSADYKSRLLCVEMKEGKPTGKITTVVEGMQLPNAILWRGDELWITDTCAVPDEFGAGGLWRFKGEEILGRTEPLKVLPKGEDEHLVVKVKVKKIGREDNSGPDGMTVDKNGIIYFGNFGDGVMYAVTTDKDGKVKCDKILDDGYQCCDGIFYDENSDLIFINDSQRNSIRVLTPFNSNRVLLPPSPNPNGVRCWTLWENDDNDGAEGLLDQPAELVVRDGKMIISNFDWPFPGLKNTKYDAPHTMSVIDITPLQNRQPRPRQTR